MGAKDIVLRPISRQEADAVVKRWHYSRKVVKNSQIHFGVFWCGSLEGALQFGPSLDKRRLKNLVSDTPWNGFIELNRMAFSPRLPRNSESRALSVALRILRNHAPQIQWVVTFADAAQCGDGTIYRAAGFVLTSVKRTRELIQLPSGEIVHRVALNTSKGDGVSGGGKYGRAEWMRRTGGTAVDGFMVRYLAFLYQSSRARLTVPVLPYSEIERLGAGMYRGKSKRPKEHEPTDLAGVGGATPTRTLQPKMTGKEATRAE